MDECKECGQKIKKEPMGPEEFKKTFKVGDVIHKSGWNHDYNGKITALGEEKFLMRGIGFCSGDKETVSQMTGYWELVDEKMPEV